jgi:hypothetical protein
MLSWLAKRLLDRNLSRLNAGDARPLLRMDADDIHFRFPGDSSWAGEIHGKPELARWLQRFVDTGLQIFADEVVVGGPPWRMTLCIRGRDYLRSPEGELSMRTATSSGATCGGASCASTRSTRTRSAARRSTSTSPPSKRPPR